MSDFQKKLTGPLSNTQNCWLRMRREFQERFPGHRLHRKPVVTYLGMHHGTCVTHVPWCMLGLLTRGGRKAFSTFPAHAQPAILLIWQEAHGNTKTGTTLCCGWCGTFLFYAFSNETRKYLWQKENIFFQFDQYRQTSYSFYINEKGGCDSTGSTNGYVDVYLNIIGRYVPWQSTPKNTK